MGFIDDAKGAVAQAVEAAKDKAHDTTEHTKQWSEELKDKVEAGADKAHQSTGSFADQAKAVIDDLKNKFPN